MAGEDIRKWHASGQQTIISSAAASIASGAVGTDTANLNLGGLSPAGYPHLQFTLRCQWATVTSIENKAIELLGRRKNVQSTNHAEVPTATYRPSFGAFSVKGVSAATNGFFVVDVFDAPQDCDWYLYNATGQTISSGWALWAYPFTFAPAA